MLRQKLLLFWADYWIQHITKTAIKLGAGILIFGGTAAIVSHPTPTPPPASRPVSVKTITPAKTSKQVTKPTVTASAPPTAVTPPPAPAPTPATTQPQPIASTQPAPGSGVKSLAPAPAPTSPASTTTTSTPPPTDPSTPATGGYRSTNWSGYVALNAKFTTVSGSWKATVATGNGATTTADSTWIGIGGVSSGDLIQTGTMNTISASGKVTAWAFYELLPDAAMIIPSLKVTPSDTMSATIKETSPGQWQIKITDVSTGQSFTMSTAYASSYSSAEWIQEDPSYGDGSLVPLDRFGTAYFLSGSMTKDGALTNIDSTNVDPITLVSTANQAIAVPSILTGSSFSVTQQ